MKDFHFRYVWVALGLAVTVWALVDETWLMPGPVSQPHAPVERRCSACHPGFSGTPENSCLACKNEMNLDLDRGIHKHAPIKRCAHCHVEHRTRAYPLASAWVVESDFDHLWTGFDLGRYHRDLKCERCHPSGRPRRAVVVTCEGCHADFHPGPWDHSRTGCDLDPLHLGIRCRECHHDGWGSGKKADCTKCHPSGAPRAFIKKAVTPKKLK